MNQTIFLEILPITKNEDAERLGCKTYKKKEVRLKEKGKDLYD